MFSLALTTIRVAERLDLDLKNPAERGQAFDYVLTQREKNKNRVLLGAETQFLIPITHDEIWPGEEFVDRFDEQEMVDMALEAGVDPNKIERGLHGTAAKKAILPVITSSFGPTTIWFNGHGGPKHQWLSAGRVGQEVSDELRDPRAISYLELGEALLQRQATGSPISEISIMIDSCYSYDFAVNLYNYLQENGAESLPVIVTETNRGQVGYSIADKRLALTDASSYFMQGIKLSQQEQKDKTITIGTIYNGEEFFEKEDGAVFVPVEDGFLSIGSAHDDYNSPAEMDARAAELGVGRYEPTTSTLPRSIIEVGYAGVRSLDNLDYEKAGVFGDEVFSYYDEILDRVSVVDGEIILPYAIFAKEGMLNGAEIIRDDTLEGVFEVIGNNIYVNTVELKKLIAGLNAEEASELISVLILHELAHTLNEEIGEATAHTAGMMAEAYVKAGMTVKAQERLVDIWKMRETDRSAWGEADIFGMEAAQIPVRVEVKKAVSVEEKEPSLTEKALTTASAIFGWAMGALFIGAVLSPILWPILSGLYSWTFGPERPGLAEGEGKVAALVFQGIPIPGGITGESTTFDYSRLLVIPGALIGAFLITAFVVLGYNFAYWVFPEEKEPEEKVVPEVPEIPLAFREEVIEEEAKVKKAVSIEDIKVGSVYDLGWDVFTITEVSLPAAPDEAGVVEYRNKAGFEGFMQIDTLIGYIRYAEGITSEIEPEEETIILKIPAYPEPEEKPIEDLAVGDFVDIGWTTLIIKEIVNYEAEFPDYIQYEDLRGVEGMMTLDEFREHARLA
ncbi:hypothetical protein KY326_04460, partial [Candidatus Woesearchaeota archaeon]|nr:hypothetical protein [Candidatus Woesearchaeota archaeon]